VIVSNGITILSTKEVDGDGEVSADVAAMCVVITGLVCFAICVAFTYGWLYFIGSI